MNQIELVIDNLTNKIAMLEREVAVSQANLTIALAELEKLKQEESDESDK